MKVFLELIKKHLKGIAVVITLGGGAALTIAMNDQGDVTVDITEPQE